MKKNTLLLCREKWEKLCEIVKVSSSTKEIIYWQILCRLGSLTCKTNDKWSIAIPFVINVNYIKKQKMKYVNRDRERQ